MGSLVCHYSLVVTVTPTYKVHLPFSISLTTPQVTSLTSEGCSCPFSNFILFNLKCIDTIACYLAALVAKMCCFHVKDKTSLGCRGFAYVPRFPSY